MRITSVCLVQKRTKKGALIAESNENSKQKKGRILSHRAKAAFFSLTHFWCGQARTHGAEIRPFFSRNVRQLVQSASWRVNLRVGRTLSSPSVEFSGNLLTPARSLSRVCLYQICAATVEASREQTSPFPTAGVQRIFLLLFRQVGDARPGNFCISASIRACCTWNDWNRLLKPQHWLLPGSKNTSQTFFFFNSSF